jgi:alpha-N-acetylgalactosaminidase
MGFPGSRNHLAQDAATFASWDVDIIKLDGCLLAPKDLDNAYIEFGEALARTQKPIIYSCSWPYYQIHYSSIIPDFGQISSHCNLWRTYHDIKAHWGSILNTIDFSGDNQAVLARHSGPGHWNDPDMLLVGNPGLSVEQAKAQFGIWALIPAPLLMSVDLRTIGNEYKQILLNKEVIAVNQDPKGIPGYRIFHNQTLDVWVRELSPIDGDEAPTYGIGILNRRSPGSESPLKVSLKLQELGLKRDKYKFKDLFLGKYHSIKGPDEYLEVSVPSTGITLLKAIPVSGSDNEV